MFVESLLVLVGLGFLVTVIFLANNASSKALLSHVESIREELTQTQENSGFDLNELKEDLLDMVHETIGNMQPPTAIDHLLGALSGPIQMWAMRKAGIDPSTGKPLELVKELVAEASEIVN
jgi:hypothetical protein